MKTNSELGDFLRSRRLRLVPEKVGIGTLKRRRTGGLRREEVAALAGISTDWYIRLEQGRAVTPSPETVEALASALRLDPAEQKHLRMLASGPLHRRSASTAPSDILVGLVQGMQQPAYLTDAAWYVLAWNAAAAELLVDFGELDEPDRNILVWMLTHPSAQRVFAAAWEAEAKRIVSIFRINYDLNARDPVFIKLVERVSAASVPFATWWTRHDIGQVSSGQKVLHHPEKGPCRFVYSSFQANEDPTWKLTVYAAQDG
jgi:transcriptional regulator with XRE-family HTH domain